MNKKVILGIGAIIILTLIGVGVFKQFGEKEENRIISIACNLPLTGDLSTYGIAVKEGCTLANEEISKSSKDIVYKIDWQDNEGLPNKAVSIFQKQKLTNYDFYISGVKPQTMAIIDEVSKIEKPHFVWIFDAFVTKKYINTFRTWVNYKVEPDYYFKYIEKKNPKKVAIIYVQLPHTDEEFNDIIIPYLKAKGISIFIEKYNIEKIDFKDIATKVKDFAPDLIILNGFKANLIRCVISFSDYDIIRDGNLICTYDLLDAAKELSPEILEGIRLIVPQFETRNNNELTEKWKLSFQERFNREPRYTDAYAYDMMYVIHNACKKYRFNPELSTSQIIKEINFEGVTGPIVFDSTGDLILTLDIAVYKNGKLIIDEITKK